MNKQGNITLFFIFAIRAGLRIIIGALIAPMGTLFSTEMYAAGEDIVAQANDSISNIVDTDVQDQYYDIVNGAQAAQTDNVEVTSAMYKYSWIFVLVLTAVVMFLLSRRAVEYGYGGFV